MSEKIDPVQHAINLEQKIARDLALPTDDAARKAVRQEMVEWMKLMESPKVRKQYNEEFGELDPKRVKAEILGQIGGRFPGVAKDLGWDPSEVSQDDKDAA